MPRQLVSGARLARRRGLTLPELLIAILLLAIVGGGITKVMIKQQQYYKDASKSAGAKRELRLGATVLPAELRSISSSGGDILEMAEDQMVLHAYTGSAVICERNAVTGADKVWVPPTNLSRHTLTSFVTTPAVGDTVFLFNENLLKGAQDDQWEKRVIIAMGSEPDRCLASPYGHIALDAGKRRPWFQFNTPIPDSVKVGAVIRFSRPVKYSIYQESSGKWYLGLSEYSGGWASSSPIAGPYAAFASGDANPSGLQFRYYDSLGVRVTNMANKTQVARVDVFLRTNSGASAITERQGNAVKDSILMRVAIRNFK